MRSLSNTIGRLAALRSQLPGQDAAAAAGRLTGLLDFGSNPGALGAWCYVPETMRSGAPLIVVLHGCTQSAAAYDRGAGWSQLADQYGFALLFPEQRRANNMNLCFNWYEPADSQRGSGEPLSIVQMIAAMVDRHDVDPARVYINGLSAGGAMTSTMLATYPETFAGGAIIAGLPFGTANGVPQAFDRMRGHGGPEDAALGALVRAASSHPGPWPSISIWHGGADPIVDSSNADAVLAQWRSVHGVPASPDRSDQVDGHPHRVWLDAAGNAVIEDYRIGGMAHGTPLSTRGEDACGTPGPHMLEAAISSTRHIANFWGLLEGGAQLPAAERQAGTKVTRSERVQPVAIDDHKPVSAHAKGGAGRIIEDALRAAGLMR
jgi:poly(hydroxyalkanoate) depolymerase family esterase